MKPCLVLVFCLVVFKSFGQIELIPRISFGFNYYGNSFDQPKSSYSGAILFTIEKSKKFSVIFEPVLYYQSILNSCITVERANFRFNRAIDSRYFLTSGSLCENYLSLNSKGMDLRYGIRFKFGTLKLSRFEVVLANSTEIVKSVNQDFEPLELDQKYSDSSDLKWLDNLFSFYLNLNYKLLSREKIALYIGPYSSFKFNRFEKSSKYGIVLGLAL